MTQEIPEQYRERLARKAFDGFASYMDSLNNDPEHDPNLSPLTFDDMAEDSQESYRREAEAVAAQVLRDFYEEMLNRAEGAEIEFAAQSLARFTSERGIDLGGGA